MRHRILAGLLLCALMMDVVSTMAATGTTLVLPMGRTKPRSGLRLEIVSHWVSGSGGYRPVTIRVSPILGGPAPAERYIDVMLRPRGWYPGSKACAAMATVHLEQGARSGEVTIDVPQTNAWNSMDVEAYEDDKYLYDLEAKRAALGIRFYYESMEGTPSILFIHRMAKNPTGIGQTLTPAFNLSVAPTPVPCGGGHLFMPLLVPVLSQPGQPAMAKNSTWISQFDMDKELTLLPDVRVLAGRFPTTYYNGYVTADRLLAKSPTTDAETMRLIADLPFLGICNHETLPDRWISLSSIDVIFVSLDELQHLATQQAEKLETLRTWLSTGTLLCVYGVGSDFARLAELERLVEVTRDANVDDSLPGWTKPNKSDFQDEIKALEDVNAGQNWWIQQANQQRRALEGDAKVTAAELNPPLEIPFVHRAVGEGRVIAIAAENPFPGTERQWSWLFNSVPHRNWLWYQRHGLSNQNQNQHFWSFLIEDIGRAPVVSFLALITLFAVMIGPVNYFVLYRRSRLYLLLVTVPVGALVVTAALFTYATLADGLGTRARVRSYTHIDQHSGRSVSWSRQMYYAGLAPSRGLSFPVEAAAYPIDYEPISSFGISDTSRKIVWGEDQNLASGYFMSRTPSQMMLVQPQRMKARLSIEDSGGKLQITNELGARATRVVVCDSSGEYWSISNLANGASAPLAKTTLEDEQRFWTQVHGESRMRYPLGFNPANMENISGIFSVGVRYGSVAPPAVNSSVMETAISDSLGMKSMRPNTYMALTERPPFVAIGVESAEEKSGFHLVVGSW